MIIPQPTVDIAQIEKEIHKAVCEIGRRWFQSVLEGYDKELMLKRDVSA